MKYLRSKAYGLPFRGKNVFFPLGLGPSVLCSCFLDSIAKRIVFYIHADAPHGDLPALTVHTVKTGKQTCPGR